VLGGLAVDAHQQLSRREKGFQCLIGVPALSTPPKTQSYCLGFRHSSDSLVIREAHPQPTGMIFSSVQMRSGRLEKSRDT
jgi:hypothetical protein